MIRSGVFAIYRLEIDTTLECATIDLDKGFRESNTLEVYAITKSIALYASDPFRDLIRCVVLTREEINRVRKHIVRLIDEFPVLGDKMGIISKKIFQFITIKEGIRMD